ncbi:MAG TPA: aspartyl protease family protein [Candidatus Acidoferrales bacterium]|nr:aspartyl protease family protein [Candidatus Acidoferrales bacterium]
MLLLLIIAFCFPASAWGQSATASGNAKPPASQSSAKNGTGGAANEALASANALLKEGKLSDAAAAFKAIVEKDPASAEAQAGLVRSLLRARKLDEAEEAGKKAVAAAPSSAPVHGALGDVDFRAGKFAEAETEYRTALRLDGNSARAWFGMARMYDMVSMHKQAKNAFAKAHQLDPDDNQIHYGWLNSLSYAEQLEAVKKAAGDHPTEREQAHIDYLSAAAQKKPWVLVSEIKPTEIKIQPWGRGLAAIGIEKGNQGGAMAISKGYGLQVKFNDRAGAVLLLDTGASGIVIGRKLAEKAGVVKIADSYFGGIGDKGPVQGYIGWVDKIKISDIEFHNCLVRVSSRNDVADESGLIGTDVFDKFLVTLDFRNWKLSLDPLPKNPNAAAEDDGPQDRYVAPEMQAYTKIWRFGHDLVIPVVVSDKAAGNFILDTGADLNCVTPKLAHQVTKLSYEGYTMKGVSGTVKQVLNGDKAILQFAKLRVRSDDIPVFDMDNISNSEGTEISGLIGIRTLVQMKMTIDYRDGLVNLAVYEFKPARE